jgi:TonB family protein
MDRRRLRVSGSAQRKRSARPRILAAALLLLAAGRSPAQETQTVPHPAPTPRVPQLTKAPALLKFVEARYPAEAEAQGLSGDVGLEVQIGADGQVIDAKVTRPAGHGFDEAAAAAVRAFVFSPAEIDGQPAAVAIEYTYHFTLSPPQPVAPPPTPEGGLAVSVSGSVLERTSKNPIAGAALRLDGLELKKSSGPMGEFVLLVEKGVHRLEVFAAGYQPLASTFEAVPGRVVELTFFLRPKIEGAYQTTVRTQADKEVVQSYTVDRTVFQRTPGSYGDPLHIIADLPGVARSPFDLGFLVVRGANPADTDFYLDGLQVPVLYHFLGGPAVVNPEFLDKFDFYPGGQGAMYGHGIGGVVDAFSRKLEPGRVHASADLNTAWLGTFLQVPLGPSTTVGAGGRISYFNFLLQPFLGAGTVAVPYFWDYQLKLDQGLPGARDDFGLMAYGSNDSLHLVTGSSGAAPSFNLDYHALFHRLVGRWTHREGAFSSTVSPMIGYQNTNTASGINGFDAKTFTAALRHNMSYELTPSARVNFGEDISFNRYQYQVELPMLPDYNVFPGSSVAVPTTHISRAFEITDIGLWAETVLMLYDRVTVIPGLRLDGYQVPGGVRGSINPRLVLKWQLTDRLLAKASVGLYNQPPPAVDFDPTYGNPGLGLLSAIQYSGGFEYRLSAPLTVSVVGFYSDRFNLLNGFLGPHPPGQVPIDNSTRGRAYGLEFYLHHDLTQRLFGWISYTLSRSEVSFGTNQPWLLSTFDQTNILTGVLSYNLGSGFYLGGRARFVTGNPYFPTTGSTFDSDSDSYVPLYGPDQARLTNFWQLDVRLDKEFYFDTLKLTLYLDIENVTFHANEELRLADYRYRYYAIVPGLPFLPILGVRVDY